MALLVLPCDRRLLADQVPVQISWQISMCVNSIMSVTIVCRNVFRNINYIYCNTFVVRVGVVNTSMVRNPDSDSPRAAPENLAKA